MNKTNLIKTFLTAAVAGGIALSANAQVIFQDDFGIGDSILLHSRNNTDGSASAYFSSIGSATQTQGFSPLGGNTIGAYFASGHFDITGLNAGIFTVDIPLTAEYNVEIIWGNVGNRVSANTIVTHANGTTSAIIDQSAGTENVWLSLGTFFFNEGAGMGEIRIDNAPFEGSSVSSNMVYDSVRLTAIPEPSTYAAIFGGLALVGAFIYRRRMSAKK